MATFCVEMGEDKSVFARVIFESIRFWSRESWSYIVDDAGSETGDDISW